MQLLEKYFPDLPKEKIDRLNALKPLYQEWNQKINVISRKDTEAFEKHHLLHSLAIAKLVEFPDESRILDVGTGGGFPGIPLAILFPEAHFHLIDSIGKKIKVVNVVKAELGLQNILAEQKRAEEIKGKYNFIVSRAVTRLGRFLPWVKDNLSKQSIGSVPNAMYFLKGGDLLEEIAEVKLPIIEHDLSKIFDEDFFLTKKVLSYQPIVKTI